ncbi:MAG TPA: hypothetical protein VEZ51_04675 [Gemmatimonadaceae bacterium]|nr:hypothetical protein [Gemmatimonadaceae bacterium]
MVSRSELEFAFDAAIAEVQKSIKVGMTTIGGESATAYLQQLDDELKAERRRAVERGLVDREWFQTTIRGLVEWVPETELSLIAALGRIVRSAPK